MMIRTLLLGVLFVMVAATHSPSAPAPMPPADPPEVAELAKARLKAAQKAYRLMRRIPPAEYWECRYVWSKRILEAQRELARNTKEIIAAFQSHCDRMAEDEKEGKRQAELRPRARWDDTEFALMAALEFYHAEAKIWLARAKAKK